MTQRYAKEFFPFGSFFLPAIEMLNNYFKYDKVPQDEEGQGILDRLLTFLLEYEDACVKTFNNLRDGETARTETLVAAIIAREYLSKLTMTSNFTLDHHYGKSKCECCQLQIGTCKELTGIQFGDTSIGNKNAWHGSLDIIFGLPDVFVQMFQDPVSPGGKITVEVKTSNLQEKMTRSQIFSEVIVFSFLQKKRHPEYKHYMIPSIAMTKNVIKFVFYDSEKDYLLESFEFEWLFGDKHLNYEAVIATWFVLNYKYLSSGVTSSLQKAPSSHFFDLVGEKLSLYKTELQFGNVQKGIGEEPILNQRAVYTIGATFVWPADIKKYNEELQDLSTHNSQ